MIRRILNYIDKYNMLDGCDNIVVGLSGGADSVCLINVLAEIIRENSEKRARDISITAVHVNHGIRGDEAKRDEEFARSVADSLGIDYRVFRLDIPGMAKKSGMSEETAGRIARYESFRSVAEELGREHTKIAVAHHMDDQAETVLMHMMRGSSIEGLAGMRAVSGDIIRPLLCVSRAEIERYLGDRGLEYVTDSTNMDNGYTRNVVRNCLIPDIENINPQFKNALNNMSDDVAEYVDYISDVTDKAERAYTCYNAGMAKISINVVHDAIDKLIIKNLIKRAYSYVHGDIVNLYRVHIDDTYGLLGMSSGKSINLPAGVVAQREQDGIAIYDAMAVRVSEDRTPLEIEIDITSPFGKINLPYEVYGGKSHVEWEVIDNKDLIKLSGNDYTKYFDYDMININPVLRHRRNGDICVIDNQGHSKRLKQELIDRKIPAQIRNDILMLAIGSDVLWAVGVRRYQQFLVTEDTRRILRISVY